MTNSGKSRELDDQTMANTTQGHALSSSDWLDSHFEAVREAYEKAAHYADIQPGWKLLDAGAGGGSYLPLLSTLVGSGGALDLPAEEHAFWQHVGDVKTESGYLNSADFYYREAFAVFVAQKPTAN